LDRHDHTFRLGAYHPLGARVSAGLVGGYVMTRYDRPIQNDGDAWSIGPRVLARLGDFIDADAGVSYTVANYRQTGTINDQTDFAGMTTSAGLTHRMNSKTTEYVRISKNINPGFESNFTDIFSLQYGLSLKVAAAVTLNGSFTFEDLTASTPATEDSTRYLIYLGTTLRIAKRWNAGLGLSRGWKESDIPDRGYVQHRVILDLTHNF
jgi:hypothetical protein